MDPVYSSFDAVASTRVEIGKRFEKYHKLLSKKNCQQRKNAGENTIASFMPSSFEQEEFNILAEYCSIDKLTVPGEIPRCENPMTIREEKWSLTNTEIPKDTELATLKMREESRRRYLSDYGTSFTQNSGEIPIHYDKISSDVPTATPGKDFLVFIRIYSPVKFTPASSRRKNINLLSSIAVLGFQTLDKIRDLIDCVSDLSITKDVSEDPDQPIAPLAKDVYKSGFFFIEDTFYIDYRDSENKDNSSVIREWAISHGLGPFKTARMEEVRIDSLCVRFGYPWVYQHQGDCEHLLVFSDARFLNVDDELALTAYPRINIAKQRRFPQCMACSVLAVHWIVTDSDRIPYNPFYFCDACFRSYNYIDGKKLGNFKAYVYPCDPSLMQETSPTTKKSPKARNSKSKTSKKIKSSPKLKTSPNSEASTSRVKKKKCQT